LGCYDFLTFAWRVFSPPGSPCQTEILFFFFFSFFLSFLSCLLVLLVLLVLLENKQNMTQSTLLFFPHGHDFMNDFFSLSFFFFFFFVTVFSSSSIPFSLFPLLLPGRLQEAACSPPPLSLSLQSNPNPPQKWSINCGLQRVMEKTRKLPSTWRELGQRGGR